MNTDDLKQDPEMDKNPFKTGDDQLAQKQLGDTRKPVVTLKALNQLRKMRELKKLEKIRQKDFVEIMYGASGEQAPA